MVKKYFSYKRFFVIIILIIFLVFVIFIAGSSENENKIDSNVYKSLEKNNEIKVIVELKEPSDEKGFLIKTKKTENEIQSEKQEIKENIISEIGKEDVRHVFDKEIAIDVSKSDLIKLNKNPDVKSIVFDKPMVAFLQDSVPLINASSVWGIKISNLNLTGINETVCILDTGANFSHSNLIGKNRTCVIDCVDKACIENCSVSDDHGHGTHVAGIVVASGSLNGVAVGANLIAVKVLDSSGSGSTSDVNAGIDWCTANSNSYNISVISMSLGTNCIQSPQFCYNSYCDNEASESSTAIRIDNATSRNISVVIATGNNGNYTHISSPACIKNATAVGWSNKDDSISGSSNRNNLTDLFAPGTNINSTKGLSSCLNGCTCSGNYMSCSGTSMAAPHIAGAFAILRQFFKLRSNRVPSPYEIENLTNSTGKRIADSSSGLNFSRIDIYSALTSIDSLNPNVNLTSPLNSSTFTNKNLSFYCSANDIRLTNLTLYIWNGNLTYNNTEIRYSNSTNSNFEINVSNISSGDYKWNCLAYDHKGNFSFAGSNFSFHVYSIITTLNSPLNNFYSKNNSINFNCSSETDNPYRLKNVTFYLWNSSSLVYNSTQNISGISNFSIFNYNFSVENNYSWNCLNFNNASDSNFAVSNHTLIYDITKPNITLIDPDDLSPYTSNSQSITFSYNVSDNFNIRNCSLIINNMINQTNSSIANFSLTKNFTQTFGTGNYNWSVNCTDEAENQENSSQRSFSVASPQSGGVSSSSGGGGGTPAYSTYSITNREAYAGYTKELNKKDRIKFSFFDEKAEEHFLTVNDIKSNYVNITVSSKPVNLILGIGQSVKLNISSSDYYEIYIKLESIENNRAKLTIQTIKEPIQKIREKIIEKIINKTQEIEKPEDKKRREFTEFEIKKLKNIIFISALMLVIVFFITLFIINKNRKNKKRKTSKKRGQ